MATTGTSTATNPRQYAWWFPGSPVRVHIDLRVIEGLQERLRDTAAGLAEQGLLFGRVQEGTTEILEFRPAFNRSVPEIIADLSADPGKRLVGYYRTGDALLLNADDLSLFQSCFGKPYQVFLVMQPNGFAPPNATFFFSQGNHKISEFPFLEFPLDASLLATEERDRISRCRQATIDPPAAAPESPPSPPSLPAKPRKRRRIFPKIAVGMLTLAVLLLPALWFTNPPFRAQSANLWTAIRNAIPKTQASSPSRPRLGLKAKWQGPDLELTWDHESPSVATATSGLISIVDGSVKREISLDVQQLRGESILYSPASDQVLIQLAVTTPTNAVPESIRVIRPGATPAYSPAATATAYQPKPSNEPVPVVRPSKTFTAPPVASHTQSPPVALNEPPALNSSLEHPAYPASVAPSLAAPSAPAPSAPTQPAPTTPQASAAAIYYPPVPLRRISPAFPAELRPMAYKPTSVAVRVAIDESGKVLKAEPLPQQNVHKLFILEAVRAAALWKFQPARRGDKPVASESILNFSFR